MAREGFSYTIPTSKFVSAPGVNHHVYINARLVGTVQTMDEAWELVGNASFGACYEIRGDDGFIFEDTIPY
jgi:hypothetical protein